MRSALIKFSLKTFSLLPLGANRFLGLLIGSLAYLFPSRSKRISLINLALCMPQLDKQARSRLAKRSFMATGQTVTEYGYLLFWPGQRLLDLIKQVDHLDIAQQALQKQRGVIFITPHIGCWELAGLYVASQFPLTCLYRPPRQPGLESYLIQAREQTGAQLVPTNASGVKAIFASLDRNQAVGILPDQDPGASGGVYAPFFGRPTNTLKLIPRLVQKTHAEVVLVYAERLPGTQGYHIHFRQVDPQIHSGDLQESAAAMNRSVEQCILECPEQYQWMYKRFKMPPPGETSPYIQSRSD